MKAAVRKKYGGPEVIEIIEVPTPTPGNHEVMVQVHASTVNRTDCGVLTGLPWIFRLFIGVRRPKRLILGTDFSGVVVKVGAQVTTFRPGDKVWGFDDEGLQSHAEYLTIRADGNIMLAPADLPHGELAAGLEGAHYAINFMNKIALDPHAKVLVNGATGAIGSAMLQMLKKQNLYTVAVANTKNIALIKALGADRTYNFEKEDFTEVDEELYDFIFDAVGKSSFGKCKKLLKVRGVYISSELGPRNENPFLALWTPLLKGKRVVFPLPSKIKHSMSLISEHLKDGSFKPVIDKGYSLDEVREAYSYTASGQKTGNVILNIT